MAKEIGAEALGRFFTDGKVRKRREWRGFKDTWYDYTRWLFIKSKSITSGVSKLKPVLNKAS